jgi:hypothetical protein
MEIQYKISIVTAIIVVLIMVDYTVGHEYYSNGSLDDTLDKMCVQQCTVITTSSFSPINLLFEIPIVTIIAIFVWYFTTKSERKNRKYTRRRIVNRYLSCLAVSGALLTVPENRTNIQNLLNFVSQNYQNIIERSNRHATLLDGNEIDNFVAEKSHLLNTFTSKLIVNPNDELLLREFYDYLRQILSDYIKNYKLNEFNEYVIKE